MMNRLFLLCVALMTLNQRAFALDLLLTAEADKPVYSVGDTAYFTGRLRNLSQETYKQGGEVEFRLSVSQDGVEIWGWSRRECG